MRILPQLRFAATLALLTAVVVAPPVRPARADEKQVCTQAYIQGQRLKQEDKLIEAREQLLVCARDTCPATLRKDCTQWSAEVEQSMPTVVVEARNADGTDAIDVRVTIDGKPFVSHLDGKPRPVNPGVHVFKFRAEGEDPVENKVVIVAGEKNRKLSVKFAAKEGDTSTPPVASTSTPDDKPPVADTTTSRPVPASVYVLGGIGLASLGAWTYFALKFDGQVADLEDCKPNCAQSAVDDAASTRNISYIPLGIGAVSLGLATVLFLARPGVRTPVEKPVTKDADENARRFDVRSVAGGAMATFSTTF